MFSVVRDVCGRPERLSPLTLSQPSLKRRCHSKACIRANVSEPYTCIKTLKVPVALFPLNEPKFTISSINASFNRRRLNASTNKIRHRGEPSTP
ncbi:hypothetical protein TNCV_4701251 [Trichonephila clavipes]|nr:hypothetical protein TNCV_4701251 [Trichonephila clavipes]